MCIDCYNEKFDKDTVVTEQILNAAKLVMEVYELHAAGSWGHLVLDDWNLDDGSVDYCLTEAQNKPYDMISLEWKDELKGRTVSCLELFKKLTVSERALALGLAQGYVKVKIKNS